MFRTVKERARTRFVSSVPALKAEMINNDELDICELTSLIDVHAMADERHFLRVCRTSTFGIFIPLHKVLTFVRASFLPRPLTNPPTHFRSLVCQVAKPHIVHATAAELPVFKYHEFAKSKVVEHTSRILAKDSLCPKAAHKEWWRSLCARYWCCTDFTWKLPVAIRCVSELPTEEAIAEVVRKLNPSLHDVQKINALRVRHFYESPAAKEKFTRMSVAEFVRKGFDFLPVPSAELTEPGANVARSNGRGAARVRRARSAIEAPASW